MNLLAKAIEVKAAQDAAKPVVKLSILARIKAYFRKRQSKKAYEALKLAKREEKANLKAQRDQEIAALELQIDALVTKSAELKRTNPEESNRLFEEALTLTEKVSALQTA
ncbi:hypothetical protein D3C76_25600 [compost metagenome]